MSSTHYTTAMRSFSSVTRKILRRYGLRITVALIWLVGLSYGYFFLKHLGLTPLEITFGLFTFLSTSWHGLILYVLLHAVRPLILFPTSLLSILAGVFFGFMLGLALTTIGVMLAAAVAYGVGRFFSYPRHTSEEEVAEASTWRRLLRTRTFEASVFLHLSFIPFDAVNYFAGIMRVRFFQFLLGTTIGTLPGVASFVSIGASLDLTVFLEEGLTTRAIDVRFLLLSVVIFIVTASLSKVVHARYSSAAETRARS